MKIFVMLVLVLSILNVAKAQKSFGVVKSADGIFISYATVIFDNLNDDKLKYYTKTNATGKYEIINMTRGQYVLKITAVDYSDFISQPITINDTLREDTIILEKKNTLLSNVTVSAKKPPVEMKAGKTIINVDALASNAGISVLELLEKSPGITVDNEGSISLKGKQGVMILIDGKPTYLSGNSLTTFLKGLNSNSLEQIEIMTNPPAKYDAAGNSGIINIKTKKGNSKGLNGSVTLNLSQYKNTRLNGNTNFNYRNKKWNIFGNYSAGYRSQNEHQTIERNFLKSGLQIVGGSVQQTSNIKKNDYHEVKIGADWAISKKDILGIVLNSNMNKEDERLNSVSDVFYTSGNQYKLESVSANNDNNLNIAANINYKHVYNQKAKELSFDMDRIYYQNKNEVNLASTYFNESNGQQENNVLMFGKLPSFINITSIKADFSVSLPKDTKLETGIKYSAVHTNNKVDYTLNRGDGWYNDLNRANHFIYKENINSAYGIISNHIYKWGLSVGLRIENTNSKGLQLIKDSSFKKQYTNLFPSMSVEYIFSDKHQVSVSYNRRIDRPDYEKLNPFIFYIDSLTYNKGNPYLKPQFSNNLELTHSLNKMISYTLNYAVTSDIITNLLRQEGEKTFQTNENLSKMQQWGIALSINKNLNKWWMFTGFANVFHNQYNGVYTDGTQNYPLHLKRTSLTTNITNTFKFNKGWGAELSGWYRTKNMRGIITAYAMGSVNINISKKIWKNNGIIRLGVRDLLNTQRFNGYARYANVDTKVINTRESRQITIGLTLKFGKSNIASARKRSSGAEAEQIRAGGGNSGG